MDSLRDAHWAITRVKDLELTLLLGQHPDTAWKDCLLNLFSDLQTTPPKTAADAIQACSRFVNCIDVSDDSINPDHEGMNTAIQLLAIRLGYHQNLSHIFKNAADWETSLMTIIAYSRFHYAAQERGISLEDLFESVQKQMSDPAP